MSVLAQDTSIQYGSSTTIIIRDLFNISISPNNSVTNTEIIGNETIFTVMPTISTLYYINGYNLFNSLIKLNQTIYVNIVPENNQLTTPYNTPITLTVNGASKYKWFPSLYLDNSSSSSVISTPLKDITYTIQGTDPFNNISIAYISINVNSNLIFSPSNPTVYDGNLLTINVNYYLPDENINYSWESNLFKGLPNYCIDYKNGSQITIHPYNTIEYKVTALNNSNILTEGYINITVIPKPSNIIDIGIIPYSLYDMVINRNKSLLQEELIKNKKLSEKIIDFYYTTLQSAYKMEWTNKNGISCKINWVTYYQIENKSNEMILSFEQQWRFFQYINYLNRSNINSNFGYLLNIVNSIYLENVQKIPIYPMEPGVF